MKVGLQLRTSQHLALTPQLQQAIRLLQMSTLELQTELEQILQANPFLECADDALAHALRLNSVGVLQPCVATNAVQEEHTSSEGFLGVNESDPLATAEWEAMDRRLEDSYRYNASQTEDDSVAPQIEAPPDLRQHLLAQVNLLGLSNRDKTLIQILIEELDDNGYLTTDLTEIAAYLPAELEVTTEELRAALHWLQHLEPLGVGARHPRECLSIQLRQKIKELPKAVDDAPYQLALTLIEHHLDLLALRDYNKIKRLLDCSDNLLRTAQALILKLNPHPGAQYSHTVASYVVPDVLVKRGKEGWRVFLNNDVVPRLRLNQLYAQVLKQMRNQNANSEIGGQLQEAKWLIKNVQQRFETILRVAQAIVERQRGFFNHGAVAMRPLVLREIADILGLHESTISRVTTQKFMLTPFGVFELKYFFGSHIATDTGGAASSTAIRALIKQLITAEDTKKPLSDSQLAQMLAEQGFVVARRTVAKYREVLKIPPVSLRKAI